MASVKKVIPKKTKLGSSVVKTSTDTPLKESTKESGSPVEVHIQIADAKKYFDATDSQLKKLRFSDVSLYSSTPTDQAKYTAELLLTYYTQDELKTKVLTDATACIGGNAWIFADYVKTVIANELSSLHADMLKNNLEVLGKTNVTTSNQNYLDIYLSTEQDIIFFDPPWGGIDYKQSSEVEIQLLDSNGVPKKIDEILLGLLQYKCETLILKLPVNYPIKKITNDCTFVNIDDLVINALDGKPLYRLVVLSHLPRLPGKSNVAKSFPRLGYKSIKVL